MKAIAASVAVLAIGLQTLPSAQAPGPGDRPSTFRVAVDAIRLDAVVTDRLGRAIPDLTTRDFVVLQDGRRQRVTSVQLVLVSTPARGASAPNPGNGLRAEQVQRTFALVAPERRLARAALSPFAESDIPVRATTLAAFSPERGMFIRALLHIDARPLSFVDAAEGRRTAAATVLAVVINGSGTEMGHVSRTFSVALTADAAAEALREGLAYTLDVPVERAGGYQVRFAVRDQSTGRIGSAGQFVEIANAAGGVFGLSGIALRADDEAGIAVTPMPAGLASAQALRVYRRGARLAFAYEIYNAKAAVTSTISLWRGSNMVFANAPDTLVPTARGRVTTAAGTVRLGPALEPGRYFLQIAATTPDERRKGRSLAAVQRTDFEISGPGGPAGER